MSLYNIQTNTSYDIPKAIWDTGNQRDTLNTVPIFGSGDYTSCIYDLSLSGALSNVGSCRLSTEAQNGAQLTLDIMINNTLRE